MYVGLVKTAAPAPSAGMISGVGEWAGRQVSRAKDAVMSGVDWVGRQAGRAWEGAKGLADAYRTNMKGDYAKWLYDIDPSNASGRTIRNWAIARPDVVESVNAFNRRAGTNTESAGRRLATDIADADFAQRKHVDVRAAWHRRKENHPHAAKLEELYARKRQAMEDAANRGIALPENAGIADAIRTYNKDVAHYDAYRQAARARDLTRLGTGVGVLGVGGLAWKGLRGGGGAPRDPGAPSMPAHADDAMTPRDPGGMPMRGYRRG